jgi:hypothetical protein
MDEKVKLSLVVLQLTAMVWHRSGWYPDSIFRVKALVQLLLFTMLTGCAVRAAHVLIWTSARQSWFVQLRLTRSWDHFDDATVRVEPESEVLTDAQRALWIVFVGLQSEKALGWCFVSC